jgi:hypothetical protein
LSLFELKLAPNYLFFRIEGLIAIQRTEVKITSNIRGGFASCLRSTF